MVKVGIELTLFKKYPQPDGEDAYVYKSDKREIFAFKSTKEAFVWTIIRATGRLEDYIDDILDEYVKQGISQHDYEGGFDEAIKTLNI